MAKSIEQLEGIGPSFGAALRGAGIYSVDDLLEAGVDRNGRDSLSVRTGISEIRILKCVNMADLFRINGVAGQYADLLHSAGVDSIKELRNRNAENLAARMAEVNAEKKLVRRPPPARVVQDWITQAGKLPPKITY